MRILSIDPSEQNTGIVLWEDGEVLAANTKHEAREVGAFLMGLAAVDIILLERPANGPGANPRTWAVYEYIYALVRELFLHIRLVLVSPGEWKPVTKTWDWRSDLADVHQRDAHTMLRYWLWRTQNGSH
jgi:hypothetical protein